MNKTGIIFDADNTIIDHKDCERQALEHLFKGIGIEYKKEYQDIFRPLDRELWDGSAINECDVPKEMIPEYRFKLLFDKIHIDYTDYKNANRLFQEGLANSGALVEDANEVIQYLYNKGYKLYIITNGLVRLQKTRIINSNISEYFSDILVSEEVGVDKPNPKIFKYLLQKNNLKPENVVMIGDSLKKDIQGAQNVNIKTIWFRYNGKINNTDIVPDYEIKSLLELKEIFK